MAINDFYDREVDAINEPSRPIPSGLIHPNEALIYTCLLAVIGLTAAFYTNPICLLVATIFFALALLYNTKGKATGLLGNLMVSACIAIPFIYGGLVVGKGDTKLLGIFALMAFLSNTGREITKSISDVEGDKRRNAKTVAICFGPKAAARTATIFYVSAVVLSIIPWTLNLISNIAYAPLVLIADAGFITSSILLLNNYSKENAKRVKTLILIWMATGLIAFLAGGY
jgi:geranylgeranylglycerol-phosphate geranylgeranyltransferase